MNINTSYFSSDAMPQSTMNVMSIMTNVLADLTQVKDPFIADDDSYLMDNGLVEQSLRNNVGGTLTIQERAYILSTNVDTLDFGYSDASGRSPDTTKLSVVPNIFRIGDIKFYDKLLTQTLESGVYLNTNRYVTLAIISQIETLSADYAAKLTKYHQYQALSACKLCSMLIDTTKRICVPFGCQYTPAGIPETSTTDLNIAVMGGIFESLERMIAASHMDPLKGSSGFATMNSMIYTGLARSATSYVPVSNEQILRSMSIFGDTLQFPTGQYVTLSRYSILDRTPYFRDQEYRIPRIDKNGDEISGIMVGWHYSWLDYNNVTKKWQLVISATGAVEGDKLAFGDVFHEPYTNTEFGNKGLLLESHGSDNKYPMTWIIDKPDNFVYNDISTHFYEYQPKDKSPYGLDGWVVNVTLNVIPASYYPDPEDPTKALLSKSFTKYNVTIGDTMPNGLLFLNKADADAPATSKVKIEALQEELFDTTESASSGKQIALYPLANNRESVFLWNPQTRYEIPRPIDFTYQGTTVESMRNGNALSSSNFGIQNFLGSGALVATMGPWTEEGAYNIRAGLAHTSAWLSHNFNVAMVPIDKAFIESDGTYIAGLSGFGKLSIPSGKKTKKIIV